MRTGIGLLLLATFTLTAEDDPSRLDPSKIDTWITDAKAHTIRDAFLREHEDRREFFRKDDPWLLPAVQQAMADPLHAPDRSRKLAEAVIAASQASVALVGAATPQPIPPVLPDGLPELTRDARDAVAALYGAAVFATAEVEASYAKLSGEERAELRRSLPIWLARTDAEGREKALSGEEDVEERERFMRCAALLEKVDLARIQSAALRVEATVDAALSGLATQKTLKPARQIIETELGPIVLRGPDNGGGTEDALIVIDFGGDDEFKTPDKLTWRPVRIHVDVGGDDIYLSRSPFAWGATLCGISVLVDAEGDDDYRARDWSLGCALGGFAVLHDRAGNDRYMGGLGTQGVGIFGTGMLVDDDGDDEFYAGLYAQGFASTGGVGALVDRQGSDTYFAGRDEEDMWRRINTWITFAQGSSYSHRFGHILEIEGKPRRWKMTGQLPGGIGYLFDAAGDDRYSADVFGQGAAYWYGLAALVDLGGNDRYRASWYGQGVGTHAAVGLVLDVSGDDQYHSRTTSQGCGHDFSAGLLFDLAGNDTYRSKGLSQGAGNAFSGLGVLFDAGGDDSYRAEADSWGFARPSPRNPDLAPFGYFVDLGGQNTYSGSMAKSRGRGKWKNGERGFGVDVDESKKKKVTEK